MGTEDKKLLRRLDSAKLLNSFMADYYYELDRTAKSGEKKIAWCTSVGPAEILRAMGFLTYFPETHAAMLGTTRMAADLIPAAVATGYSPDICSYLTSDLGAFLKGVSPLGRAFPGIQAPPKPDVLVYNTNQCRDVQDWFRWYGRHYGVPVVGVETHRNIGQVTEAHIGSIVGQLENLIQPLEAVAGRKMDMDQLREAVRLSRRCSDLWDECLATAVNRPAPLTFFDQTTLMGPAVVGRGTQQAVDAYEKLLAELKERAASDIGALAVDERFRLYWDGMPVWGRLGMHSKLFAGLGANVVASTYCSSWIFTLLDPDQPLESMARAYTELFIVRDDEYKEKYIQKKIEMFGCDGAIYHNAKTCPNNSNCSYGLPQRVEKTTGVPFLTIDGDLNDMRCVSDEQNQTNIEAFVEQLEELKEQR